MNSYSGGSNGEFPSNGWKEIAEFFDDEAMNKVFPTEKVQELGGKAVNVVEQEADQHTDDDSALGAESSPEAEEGSEARLRQELGAWLEDMAGTPEEYWQKLEERWWVNEGVPLERYGAPRTDLLVEKAKGILKSELPGLDEAGLQTRAELATKVALEDLAAKEVEMLKQAKINRKGERKLKKGWDVALLHQAYYAMQDDLAEVYRDGELAKDEADNDGLSESEGVAWWVKSVPEGEERTRRLEIKQGYDQQHKKAEVAVVSQGEVMHLGPDEAEEIKPEPIVTVETLKKQDEQMELSSAPEETGLAVVEQQDKTTNINVEEALAKAVSETTGLISVLQRQIDALEDDDPEKHQLMQTLAALRVQLIETQAAYEGAKGLIIQREEERDAGLSKDPVGVKESDNLAYGSLVLEELYARGMLKREQSLEEQIGLLESMQQKAAEKLKSLYAGSTGKLGEVTVQISELEEFLKKAPFAVDYLNNQLQNEQEKNEDDSIGEVTDFPSDEALRQVDQQQSQAS